MFSLLYRQKLIASTPRYVQLCMKHSHVNINNCQSKMQNVFMNYSSRMLASKSHYNHNKRQYKGKIKHSHMAVAGLFSGLFDFWRAKEDEDIPELIMTLKRSILLIQRGQFQKAEQMLHVALNQAQLLQSYEGVTYTYDVMANLAFDTKDYKKAETLFVSVLQRLISTGTAQNDPKVIHISLKMAKLFEETGEAEKAEQGYQFCLEELQNHLAKGNENEDILALLGMTLDWYAHMLFAQFKYSEALKHLIEAYNICVKLNGEIHEQSVTLLNDLGTTYYMIGQYDIAQERLSLAVKLGKKLVDMIEYGSVHVNLGNVFLKKGMIEEATKACETGRRIGRSREDENTIIQADKCLHNIKVYLSSKQK